MIEPIDERQRQQVVDASYAWIRLAGRLYGREFATIPVLFDLSGRAAGMYRVRKGAPCIRYNPWLFAKYFRASLAETVPHEVAHYIADRLYGLRNIRPHGSEWRAVMQAFGATPRVTGDFDLADIPVRRQARFEYHCQCSSHRLSACRHRRVHRGEARYACKRCGTALVFAGEAGAA